LSISVSFYVHAQSDLLTWESSGLVGNETSFSSNSNILGVGTAVITRGAGLSVATNANRINATNWAISATVDAAVTGNKYFEFTITPNTGKKITVSQFVFNYERSGTGPSSLTVRSSVDGYVNNLGSVAGLAQTISSANIINITGITDIATAITFRIYGFNATGTGGSGGFENAAGNDFIVKGAVTDFGTDNIPPVLQSVSPSNNATNVTLSTPVVLSFNEAIAKGTGNITLFNVTDNTSQVIDVTSANITINGASATISFNLLASKTYYVEVASGVFKDLSNNIYSGFTGNGTLSFNTIPPPSNGILENTYNFNTCGQYIQQGFQTYSVTGAQVWGCTKFGRTFTTDPSTDSAIQINGFSGSAILNEDWLISPKFDLTGTNIPLLKFYSRTTFAGPSLTLKVSTNYSGTGDPSLATWTNITGKFPATSSDVWTLSDSINLNAFKAANVYVAWVYTSSPAANAARWTIDDITFFNSTTAPAPSLTISPANFNFGFVALGSNSSWKPFVLTGADFTGPLTLSAPVSFEIAIDTSFEGSSINYSAASVNNSVPKTFYLRFVPNANDKNFSDQLTATSDNLSQKPVTLTGTSLSPAKTLEVMNWNVEWFGSTAANQGPVDDDLAQDNVKKILREVNADIYLLQEIVDTSRLRKVVDSLGNTEYGFVVSDYSSRALDTNDPDWITGQKLAYIYRKSIFTNIRTYGILSSTAIAEGTGVGSPYDRWASGRWPFLFEADATINGTTKRLTFINVHGESGATVADYDDRKVGVQRLKDTLDAQYSTANIIIGGDFNDDLDVTISPVVPNTSSWSALTSDSTDADSYKAITLPLSYAGFKSTVSFNDMIDHTVISNELADVFMASTAQVRTDVVNVVATNATNYASTTSDHYPVYSRFNFAQQALPSILLSFNATRKPGNIALAWKTSQEINSKEFVLEKSKDGQLFIAISKIAASGNSNFLLSYTFTDYAPYEGVNYYRLKMIDKDGKFQYSKTIKLDAGVKFGYTLSPNPAKNMVIVELNNLNSRAMLQLVDVNGRILKTENLPAAVAQQVYFNINSVARGLYFIRLTTDDLIDIKKVIIE
jgi:Bacterial Ig-like domain/Secretion system C-terminal sorting domain/Endonuclease/Exonuclease/phosphatase family